jgi:hypothetical protein
MSELMPDTARAEQGVHLVEEDDDGNALVGLLASSLEDEPDLTLRLADVLVEQLGTLDVEKVGANVRVASCWATFVARELAYGFGDRVSCRIPEDRRARCPWAPEARRPRRARRCRYGSSTASVIASIWVSRPPTMS